MNVLIALCLLAAEPKTCCTDMLCPLCQQETQLIREVNLLRARHGRGPLERDVRLVNGCRHHCYRQARRRSMYHQMDGYAAGECVAAGQRNVTAAVQSWYHSSGHRPIMLGGYSRIGASRNGAYWTLRVR